MPKARLGQRVTLVLLARRVTPGLTGHKATLDLLVLIQRSLARLVLLVLRVRRATLGQLVLTLWCLARLARLALKVKLAILDLKAQPATTGRLVLPGSTAPKGRPALLVRPDPLVPMVRTVQA